MQQKATNRSEALAWFMWGTVCLYFLYQFFVRVAPTVLDRELMVYFSLTAPSFGTLCGYYYFSYALLQLPVGLIVDKYGPRCVSAIACVTCGLGSWLFVCCQDYAVAAVGRILAGVGSAAAFIAAIKIGLNWFKKLDKAFVNNLTITIGTLGACAGAPLFAYAKQFVDWREILVLISVFGVILGIVIFAFVRNYPKGENHVDTPHKENISIWEGLKLIMKSGQCWLAYLYILFLYAPLSGFADMWGVPFIKAIYGIDVVKASSISNMMYVGTIIGGPLFAWFSTARKGRKICLWTGTIISAVSFTAAVFIPGISCFMFALCMFFVGFGSVGGFTVYTVAVEIMPPAVSGTITGVVNMFSMVSGVILQPFLGWIIKQTWDGTIIDGLPVYSAYSYTVATSVVIICLFISLAFIPFFKESFPGKQTAK
ncbi:MAG: MFS transporter [Holosporales bacterium]|jgi:MFS family permease|nr:MFS transporter [Holosporales bacterium]